MSLFVDRNFSHGFAVIKKSQYKAITVAYIEAKFSFVTWAWLWFCENQIKVYG